MYIYIYIYILHIKGHFFSRKYDLLTCKKTKTTRAQSKLMVNMSIPLMKKFNLFPYNHTCHIFYTSKYICK